MVEQEEGFYALPKIEDSKGKEEKKERSSRRRAKRHVRLGLCLGYKNPIGTTDLF